MLSPPLQSIKASEVPKKAQKTDSSSKFFKRDSSLVDINKSINRLIYGQCLATFTKKSSKLSQPMFVHILDYDLTKLRFIPLKKSAKPFLIDLKNVNHISELPTSIKSKTLNELEVKLLLSINYGVNDEIVFLFEDRTIKNEFWCGIEYFMEEAHHEDVNIGNAVSVMTRDIFTRANIDGTQTLSRKDVKAVFKYLHIETKSKGVDDFFKRYDKDNDKKIDPQELEQFLLEKLRKEELIPLFTKYACNYKNGNFSQPAMTLLEFMRFCEKEQKQKISVEEVRTISPTFEKVGLTTPCISFDFFGHYIFSFNNTLYGNTNIERYQDQSKPLTDYYINSSHNTYLMSNQLTGESSVQAYVNAIKKGCRCVELDIWTGNNSVPVVYHGHTMTSKILFEDIIKAVKDHAFTKTSAPMILSFEMHCNIKTQVNIVEILRRELGDKIFVIPEDHHTYPLYPSLNQLQNKVLIKGKGKLKQEQMLQVVDTYESTDSEDELPNRKNLGMISEEKSDTERIVPQDVDLRKFPAHSNIINTHHMSTEQESQADQLTIRSQLASKLQQNKCEHVKVTQPNPLDSDDVVITLDEAISMYEVDRSEKETLGLTDTFKPKYKAAETPAENTELNTNMLKILKTDSLIKEVQVDEVSAKTKKKTVEELKENLKVHPELEILYSMLGKKMKLGGGRKVWEISSINETKIAKLFKDHHTEIVEFHKRFFSRIYPGGSRVDSSNYNPIIGWAAGAQIVALNFQKSDEPMLLNYAKFATQNGFCAGYVLKPEYMRNASLKNKQLAKYPSDFTKIVKKLTITVISGQQIRSPESSIPKEIVDPFIEVKVRGLDIDEKNNTVYKTPTIQDNGFHPVWSTLKNTCKFEFLVHAPDFCTLVFTAYDGDVIGKDKLGWYAIDFNNIREGYRVVPILDDRFKAVKGSFLLCHIKITDVMETA